MSNKRLIAVILLEDDKVIQSENFNHTNVIHYSSKIAIETFSQWRVDEIIILNVSKKKDEKKFLEVLRNILKKCFVPITVGGWIDNMDFAKQIFKEGADKISINSTLFDNINLVKNFSNTFGAQALVASIDYKFLNSKPVIFKDRARKKIDTDIFNVCKKIENFVGEILLTCIDNEGMNNGYELETLGKLSNMLSIPIIAFGGAFEKEHFYKGFKYGASAVAAANYFHYKEFSTYLIKDYLKSKNIILRKYEDYIL